MKAVGCCYRLVGNLLGSALLFVSVVPAEAQQPAKIARIGFLDDSTASGSAVLVDVFWKEMRKLGWVEGKSITIEYRFAESKYDRLPELAADLVRQKVDLIVVSGGPTARAAKGATGAIPIVMVNISDPVGQGFVASLARPKGNITGLSFLAGELGTKGWRYSRMRFRTSPEWECCGLRDSAYHHHN